MNSDATAAISVAEALPTSTHLEQTSTRRAGFALMFIGLALYPLSDAFIKHLLESHSVHQTTFLRAVSRFIPLLFVALLKTGSFQLLQTGRPSLHAVRLIISVISTYSFMWAYSIASLTSICTLSYTSPIFILIFGKLVLREKVDWRRWLAVLVGLFGVIIALHPSYQGLVNCGSLVVLAGTLFAALNKICMRELTKTEDSLTIAMYPNIVMICITAPMLIDSWKPMSQMDWALFVVVGLLTALAQYCVSQALRCTEASRLAPIDYSTLMWAVIIDYVRWDLVPYTATFIGAAFIILSNIYIIKTTHTSSARS